MPREILRRSGEPRQFLLRQIPVEWAKQFERAVDRGRRTMTLTNLFGVMYRSAKAQRGLWRTMADHPEKLVIMRKRDIENIRTQGLSWFGQVGVGEEESPEGEDSERLPVVLLDAAGGDNDKSTDCSPRPKPSPLPYLPIPGDSAGAWVSSRGRDLCGDPPETRGEGGS